LDNIKTTDSIVVKLLKLTLLGRGSESIFHPAATQYGNEVTKTRIDRVQMRIILYYINWTNPHGHTIYAFFLTILCFKIKVDQKELTKWNFVSMISQLKNHRNSKILVPTPHNNLVIIWGRENKCCKHASLIAIRSHTRIYNILFIFSHISGLVETKKWWIKPATCIS
jgi:hypothetical protein